MGLWKRGVAIGTQSDRAGVRKRWSLDRRPFCRVDWVTKRLGAGETYEEAEDQARGGKAGLNQGSHCGDGEMRAQRHG